MSNKKAKIASFSGANFAAELAADAERIKAEGGGIKNTRASASDIHKINPLVILIEEGFNLRTVRDADADEELYQSVLNKGVTTLPALVIRTNKDGLPVLVDGHRRLEAIKRAIFEGGLEIPLVGVVTEAPGFNDRTRVAAIFRYNSGQQLHQLDQARGIEKFLSWGWDADRITVETGKNAAQQARLVRLLENPEEVNAFVASGALSATAATKIVKDTGSTAEAVAQIEAMAAEAKDKGAKRLLPKHNKAAEAVSAKKVGAALFISAQSEGKLDKTATDGSVTLTSVTFTAEQWANVVKAFGLKA